MTHFNISRLLYYRHTAAYSVPLYLAGHLKLPLPFWISSVNKLLKIWMVIWGNLEFSTYLISKQLNYLLKLAKINIYNLKALAANTKHSNTTFTSCTFVLVNHWWQIQLLTCPCMFIMAMVLLLLHTMNWSGCFGNRWIEWMVTSISVPDDGLNVLVHSVDLEFQICMNTTIC